MPRLERLFDHEQNVSRVGLSFRVPAIPGGQGFLDGLEFGQGHRPRKIIKLVLGGIPKHPRQPADKLQLKVLPECVHIAGGVLVEDCGGEVIHELWECIGVSVQA